MGPKAYDFAPYQLDAGTPEHLKEGTRTMSPHLLQFVFFPLLLEPRALCSVPLWRSHFKSQIKHMMDGFVHHARSASGPTFRPQHCMQYAVIPAQACRGGA